MVIIPAGYNWMQYSGRRYWFIRLIHADICAPVGINITVSYELCDKQHYWFDEFAINISLVHIFVFAYIGKYIYD